MLTPRIEIDLAKIAHNVKSLKEQFGSKGIDVIGVTKVVCGDHYIANILVECGIAILADSRIDNIKKMRDAGIRAMFLLLRTPSLSQAEKVIKYADISLNTELLVLSRLSILAARNGIIHKVILMVEMGDLREGLMLCDLEEAIEHIVGLDGISLAGIGTNLACFGGIKPDDEKMERLSNVADRMEKIYGLKFEFISGGNSANYNWLMSTKDVGRINSLRLGESIYLGCETLKRKPIPGLFVDAFTLVAEVIEIKTKPSLPYGEVCQDAFGNVPEFIDHGQVRRAILGIGLQDVLASGLNPRTDIDILGASSDHIIINANRVDLSVGDEVEFDLDYGALLPAMTSPYVAKRYR